MTTVTTTFDGAMVISNAAGGVPAGATYDGGLARRSDGALYVSNLNQGNYDPRTLLIGDSHLCLGFSDNGINITGFDVTAGVATLTFTGNHGYTIGNKITLSDISDATTLAPLPLSCFEATLLTANASTLTFAATINGVAVPNSVSSTDPYITGRTWRIPSSNNTTDSSILSWINAFCGYPFYVTKNFTATGATSTQFIAALSKIQGQAPKSSYSNVIISLGTNSPMLTQAVQTTAWQAADTEYNNIMALADALYSTGTVYVLIPIGGSSTNPLVFTRALAWLRRRLLATRRSYRIQFLDVFAASLDGTSATGATVATYVAGSNHLSSLGGYRIARQWQSWLRSQTLNPYNVNSYKMPSYQDDTTSAWLGGTVYGAGAIVTNAANIYSTVAGGTSGATSTGGPTGTSPLVDNNIVWAYVGTLAGWSLNHLTNGGMQGTGGTNTAGFVAGTTVPTGWTIGPSSPANVTLATASTLSQQTITVVPAGSDAIPGYGWNVAFTSTGNSQIILSQSNGLRLKGGNWYQIRVTVTCVADSPTLRSVALRFNPTVTGAAPFQVRAGTFGNNGTTMPMLANDTFELVQTFYYPTGLPVSVPSDNGFFIDINNVGSGTVSLQFSNASMVPIPDPNTAPSAV